MPMLIDTSYLRSSSLTCHKCKGKHKNSNNLLQQKKVRNEYGLPLPSQCVSGMSSGDRCPYSKHLRS